MKTATMFLHKCRFQNRMYMCLYVYACAHICTCCLKADWATDDPPPSAASRRCVGSRYLIRLHSHPRHSLAPKALYMYTYNFVMNICIYVYIHYICMYVYIRAICIQVYMYMYIYIYTHTRPSFWGFKALENRGLRPPYRSTWIFRARKKDLALETRSCKFRDLETFSRLPGWAIRPCRVLACSWTPMSSSFLGSL